MTRTTIALIVGIAFILPCDAQQKKSDAEVAGLVGKVKTVKVEETKLSDKAGQRVEGKKSHVESQSYNQSGTLTKAVRFDAGRPTDYFYSYDSSGNRLEFSRTLLGESRIKTEFKYDATGNRIEEIQTSEGGLVNRIAYSYDASGRITERRIYNKQGLFARRTYSYGSGANATEESEYDGKGGLAGKQSYAYQLDATGNWIKRITSSHGTNNGKPVTEPVEVTYRTITYY